MAKLQIYKFRRIYVKYKNTYRSNLKEFKGKKGVYIIKEFKNYKVQSPEQRKANRGQIVYIGKSTGGRLVKGKITKPELEGTILRHFQRWSDESRVKTTGGGEYTRKHTSYKKAKYNKNRYTVSAIETKTIKQANDMETYLIQKYNPRDNYQKVDLFLSDRDRNKSKSLLDSAPRK